MAYFQSRRHTCGIVMLLMALLLLSASMRAYETRDMVSFTWNDSTYGFLVSGPCGLSFHWFSGLTRKWKVLGDFKPFWKTSHIGNDERDRLYFDLVHLGPRCETTHWTFAGFHLIAGDDQAVSGIVYQIWIAPYWAIVAAPTLLSACMLFSKTRSSAPQVPPTVR